MFRFLPGILIVEAATLALLFAIPESSPERYWPTLAVLLLIIALLASLWFSSLASHAHKDAVARVREDFAREREKIRVKAERDKTRVIEKSHKRIVEGASRAQARANFKVGAAFAGALGAGLLMLMTQFVTLGVLTLSTAGGALVGYGVRARQELKARKEKVPPPLPADTPPVRVITDDSADGKHASDRTS